LRSTREEPSLVLEPARQLRPARARRPRPTQSITPASNPEHAPARIHFAGSRALTLGVEIELQLLDPVTLELCSRATELLRTTYDLPHVKPELYQSMIELCTGICIDAHQAEHCLADELPKLMGKADRLGIAVAGTACHPFSKYTACEPTRDQRYDQLIERNQWLTRRMAVCGLHVHLGMRSGEECIRFLNAFHNFLPHLLALSASSPFWQEQDTGLASCRPTVYASLPTAGHPYELSDWPEFERVCDAATRSGSIRSLKDLWWDIRPSPRYGTLEIRVCDAPATLKEVIAITAFVQLLALLIADNAERGSAPSCAPPRWVIRENKWRAMRYGLDAEILVDGAGAIMPLRGAILGLLEAVEPDARKLGYQQHLRTIEQVLSHGNSSARQRKVLYAQRSYREVMRHNMREFTAGAPIWS